MHLTSSSDQRALPPGWLSADKFNSFRCVPPVAKPRRTVACASRLSAWAGRAIHYLANPRPQKSQPRRQLSSVRVLSRQWLGGVAWGAT